jgi:hypothetical protein
MPRLTDELENLERELAKYPDGSEESHLNRRLLLREAFQSWGDARYSEGLGDGRRDVFDARRLARDAEKGDGDA